MLLMVQKSQTTTWDVQNPVNNGINCLLTGAGFLPSTVLYGIYLMRVALKNLSGCVKHFRPKSWEKICSFPKVPVQVSEVSYTKFHRNGCVCVCCSFETYLSKGI